MSKDTKADWAAFGEKLIAARQDIKPTRTASASFVKRMTSASTEPDPSDPDLGTPPAASNKDGA